MKIATGKCRDTVFCEHGLTTKRWDSPPKGSVPPDQSKTIIFPDIYIFVPLFSAIYRM